jgi:hypothetical protein
MNNNLRAQKGSKSQLHSLFMNDPRQGGRTNPRSGWGYASSGIRAINNICKEKEKMDTKG